MAIQIWWSRLPSISMHGMRRVYGRCDHFRRQLNMDICRTRQGRLLARFWSRSNDIDAECWEVIGTSGTCESPGPPFEDRWIPSRLREEYESWVISNV